MDNPTYHFVHPSFKLNGFHRDREGLFDVAEHYIKEGDDFEKELGVFIFDWFGKESFIQLTTSGTTGKPKNIKVEKQAMVESALATGAYFELLPGNKALHCLSVKYIAGKMMFIRGIVLGLELYFVMPNSNPMRNTTMKYDFAAMVPLQVQNSLRELKNVKKLIIGGAGINDSLKAQILELSIDGYETYGMTETITHIAVKKIGEKVFTTLPNVTISCDSNHCLEIHAPRILNKKIKTNDVVEIINEKQFVFLGRYDNAINSGGIKLFPEQIEDKLSGKIFARFFISGIPDEVLGEKVILIIEGEKQKIDGSIFDVLGKYEKPKEVMFIPNFLETENGKIKREDTLNRIL